MRIGISLLALSAAPVVAATPVVISSEPDKVAVTVYADPDRGEDPMRLSNLDGFALITETRTVDLPPGVVTVRFEGVAGGIVPQSAILFGAAQAERNRDTLLLSQNGLVDAFTGQQVIIKRTDPATGKVSEEPATIRSAADRLVVTTARGTEALYCSGLNQTLIYPRVPSQLSAKPVLSMTTRDQPGGRATLTLAYIAGGFDWQATYVGELAPDGKSLSLLAWLTMASQDQTSFPEATANAVAGRVNRTDATRGDAGVQALDDEADLDRQYGCWPAGTTSDGLSSPPPMVMPPPPAPIAMGMAYDAAEVVVTAQRKAAAPPAVKAVLEGLGDLKLYRIPVPVTIAARAQKQVAFLTADKINGQLVYRARVAGDEVGDLAMLFRFANTRVAGLGDPLPAGKVELFQDSLWGRQLVGELRIADKAVGEEVEFGLGRPSGVTIERQITRDTKRKMEDVGLTIRNANPFPVRFELEFPTGGAVYTGLSRKLTKKPGKQVWTVTLPPASATELGYGLRSLVSSP